MIELLNWIAENKEVAMLIGLFCFWFGWLILDKVEDIITAKNKK